MVDVSIGVVTHNNSGEILNLLSSIYAYTSGITFTVSIVDNLSEDNTVDLIAQKFPQVNIIKDGENRGFGHGHNRLLNVDSRYHLVCNPDIVFTSNLLKSLVEFMDSHSDCAIVTPKVLSADGTEQKLPKRKPTAKFMLLGRLSQYSKAFKKYRDAYTMADVEFTKPTEIEFCTGCFMFLRTEVWKKVGGFDERFFMYLEDADLSDRVRKYGKIIFEPNVSVVHRWERGSAKNLKLLLIHFQSMFKYLAKQRKKKS